MRKRASFLTADERKALLNVMRKRKVEALKVRRANALVALDDGHSVQMVSRIFYLDPDENGGDKLIHGSGGNVPAAGGAKICHL